MKLIKIRTTKTEEMVDISTDIQREITATGFKDGLCLAYCPHTTAGLTINEGTDPAVKADLLGALSDMVPWDKIYGHTEGNSPAHVKASLMGSSQTLIVEEGRLALGQWQRLFFCEFDGPRPRKIMLKFLPQA